MCLTPFTDADVTDKSRWEWLQQLLLCVPDEYNDSYEIGTLKNSFQSL